MLILRSKHCSFSVGNSNISDELELTLGQISLASLNVPSDAHLTPEQWHSDPTFLNIQVDLYSVLLGLNQRENGGLDEVRSGNRLRAARGLASLASVFRDSSRLYAHIPLVVSYFVVVLQARCESLNMPSVPDACSQQRAYRDSSTSTREGLTSRGPRSSE